MAPVNKSDKDRVIIFDTTLRDGEQSPGVSMNFEEKIHIAESSTTWASTSSKPVSRSPPPATSRPSAKLGQRADNSGDRQPVACQPEGRRPLRRSA